VSPITPAQAQELVRADTAALPHGRKGGGVGELAMRIGKSRATVYRHLKQVTVRAPRKARSDKGQVALALAEAQMISAWLMDGLRKGDKQLRSVEQALRELRYVGKVRAERIDPATGEVAPLSASTVARALRHYGLHPKQLLRPAPAAAMQSLHPNHVWEIDASLCVLYYLKTGGGKQTGLQVMDADKFYKNKPKALERIENERVWRYLCVDHYSGSIFCHYVLGAESGANLVESFIRAVTPRTVAGQTDPFCGVPFIAYMDPGSANTGALFQNLARRVQMRVIAHAPGNARATGGVERPHDIWEHVFESALRSEPVSGIEELNEAAMIYARHFNATQVHTRHGRTRTAMWLTISAEHKRIAPDADVLRQLATHQPESRKVEPWPGPVVRFGNKVYDVSQVPNVMIGEKLHVTHSPYLAGHACVVLSGEDGAEQLLPVPEVEFNEAGYPVTAAVIGEEYRRPADTILQTNRKLVERLAMGADTDEQAAAARRARKPAFNGEVRPLAQARETILPTPLPRRGTELELTTTTAAAVRPARLLTLFEAARTLSGPVWLGKPLLPAQLALLRQLHPDGVPEDQLAALQQRLATRGALRVVGSD
jgi:DNA-binding transcriptional ArsR family regulator